MELYKGLPIKTITATDREGIEHIFGVTTEEVDSLINNFLLDSLNEDLDKVRSFEEFDNSYGYAVPQVIFEMDEEDILSYINNEIDDMGFYIE